MSKIRIYSKKAFDIGPGADRETSKVESFLTVPGSFQEMPDKYLNDPTFKLAVQCGEIIIMNDAPAVPVATSVPEAPKVEEDEGADNDKLVNEYYEKVKTMNAEEVQVECNKYNATFVKEDKLKENKKRLMEAYKLSLN